MALCLTAQHEAHHLAAEIAPPPPAFEGPVGPAEGVDHRGHLGVRFAENVEHALRGQVACHLLPHDVAQVFLRDVQPDAQCHWEVHQVEPVGDDEHAVDGDLDTDHVVVVRWDLVHHACPVCVRVRMALFAAPSAWSYRFAAWVSLSHRSSEIAAIFEPALRRAASTAVSAQAEADATLPWVLRTAASAPSASIVAHLMSAATRACVTARSRKWAVLIRKLSPGMVPSSLSSVLQCRRPGCVVGIQRSHAEVSADRLLQCGGVLRHLALKPIDLMAALTEGGL